MIIRIFSTIFREACWNEMVLSVTGLREYILIEDDECHRNVTWINERKINQFHTRSTETCTICSKFYVDFDEYSSDKFLTINRSIKNFYKILRIGVEKYFFSSSIEEIYQKMRLENNISQIKRPKLEYNIFQIWRAFKLKG